MVYLSNLRAEFRRGCEQRQDRQAQHPEVDLFEDLLGGLRLLGVVAGAMLLRWAAAYDPRRVRYQLGRALNPWLVDNNPATECA